MDENEVREIFEYFDEVLHDYEKMVNNIGRNGLSASLLMNYRDEIQDIIAELALENINLKEHWKKITLLDTKLRSQAQRYVNEVGHNNFKQYQIINNPSKERWWWYLDKTTLPPPYAKKNLWDFWKK